MVNSKTNFSFIFLFAFVFALSIVSAQTDFGYNNLDLPTLSKTVINYTQTNVNSSDFWDDLDTPADIFFADLSSSSFTLASGDSISFDYLTTGLQNLYKAEILHSIVDNAGVDVLLIDDGVAFTRSLVASNGYHMLDFSTMGFADFIDNDINTTGDVHANTYYGNGSQLTGIESGWDGNITAPNGKNLSLNKVDTNSLSTIKDNVLSVAPLGEAKEIIVLQSRDGISAGEFGAVELGDDDVRLSLNGKSIYQYLDGVIKYLLDTTGFHFYDDVEIIGDANITGDLIVQGSTTTLENVIVGGNFTAKRPYGMFSSAESHIAIAADTVYAINFSHIEDNYLMSLEGAENITIQQSGDYLIELSVIVVTDANNKHFDIFPQTTHGDGVTFVNVPRSNTKISIENAGTEQVIAVPFILDLNAGDKFRIMYASDAAGSMTVASVEHGAGVNAVPATPSIIMTASKISEITD